MAFWLAVLEPVAGQGAVTVGPFGDRSTAEQEVPMTREGIPVPKHIIEAETQEEASRLALQAFGLDRPPIT